MGRHDVLGGFEGELALLGDADEHHTFRRLKATTMGCSDIVFALAALELNDRHQLLLGKCRDVLHEAIVKGAERGRRGNPIAEVVAQEGTQLTARLELGHVAVEVQTVNARSGQRDVVAQYRGDVGAWHRRRLPRGQGEHVDGATPASDSLFSFDPGQKKDDRLPIIRNFPSGKRGERVTRRAATSVASEGLRTAQLTHEGQQAPRLTRRFEAKLR